MKTAIAILICFAWICPKHLPGQNDDGSDINKKISALYLDLSGARTSKGSQSGAGIHILFPTRWGGSLSYGVHTQTAKSTPAGYNPGSLFGIRLSSPEDELITFAARAIHTFPLDRKFRIGVESGFSFGKHTTAKFTPDPSSAGKYFVSYRKDEAVGLSLRVSLDALFSRYIGIGAALITDINRINSFVGIDLHLLLGLTRDRVKPVEQ